MEAARHAGLWHWQAPHPDTDGSLTAYPSRIAFELARLSGDPGRHAGRLRPGGVTREQVVEGLRRLLALPVEVVLRRIEHRQTMRRSIARSPDG